jgi:hypothetical protein
MGVLLDRDLCKREPRMCQFDIVSVLADNLGITGSLGLNPSVPVIVMHVDRSVGVFAFKRLHDSALPEAYT